MKINLHIECLVLDGLAVTVQQGELIQVAVESELARMFDANGLPKMTGAALRNLTCGPIQFARESRPAQIGNQIAQAVYSGLVSITPTPSVTQN